MIAHDDKTDTVLFPPVTRKKNNFKKEDVALPAFIKPEEIKNEKKEQEEGIISVEKWILPPLRQGYIIARDFDCL